MTVRCGGKAVHASWLQDLAAPIDNRAAARRPAPCGDKRRSRRRLKQISWLSGFSATLAQTRACARTSAS
jgi:hypothetical protein